MIFNKFSNKQGKMMKKTLRKLLNKEIKKPLHCIDSNIFLESTVDSKLGEICKSHLSNMGKGKYYRGIVPVSVLGEINLIIFRDLKEPIDRISRLELLEKFIRLRDIDFVAPKREDHLLIDELMEAETRLEEMDAEHLVCAKRAGASVFLTFDSKLLGNRTLESILGMRIKHPQEFVNLNT